MYVSLPPSLCLEGIDGYIFQSNDPITDFPALIDMWRYLKDTPYDSILTKILHSSSHAGGPPAWGDADKQPWPRQCSIFTGFDIPADHSGKLFPPLSTWRCWNGVSRVTFLYIVAFGCLQASSGWSSVGEANAVATMERVLAHIGSFLPGGRQAEQAARLDEGCPVSDGVPPLSDGDENAMDAVPSSQIVPGPSSQSPSKPSNVKAPPSNAVAGPSSGKSMKSGLHFPNKSLEMTIELPPIPRSSRTPSPRKLATIPEEIITRMCIKPFSTSDGKVLTRGLAVSKNRKRQREATPANSTGSGSGGEEEDGLQDDEVEGPPKKKGKVARAAVPKKASAPPTKTVKSRGSASRTKSATPAPAAKGPSTKGKEKASEPAGKKATKADVQKAGKVEVAYSAGIGAVAQVS